MIHELQTFEPIFDHEHKIFGNAEGLIMKKDRRSLAGQSERQNGDFAQLKESMNTIKMMDIWPERNFRNETAHGGGILTDIEPIEYMDRADARRADSWKRTFENLYSISFSDGGWLRETRWKSAISMERFGAYDLGL